MERVRMAVIASGRGSTAEAAVNEEVAEIIVAITNNGPRKAGIWERAERLNFPLIHLPRTPFRIFSNGQENKAQTKIKHTEAIADILGRYDFDWIFLDGCSFPIAPKLIKEYPNMFNIHPAPLDPGYLDFGGVYGLTTYAWVKYFSEQIKRPFQSEATLHLVDEEYDKGNLLLTRPYKTITSETVAELGLRALKADHLLAIEFCRKIRDGYQLEPFQRPKRLIPESEIPILQSAKKRAIADYPSG